MEEGPRAEVTRAKEDEGMGVLGKRTPNHLSLESLLQMLSLGLSLEEALERAVAMKQ